jgi:phenylpropionate dioxygenase-like ring-hydroxylating dioxygenase large terminal subunit
MKQEMQIALVHRIKEHLEARTTDTAAAPATLDVAAYLDEARHAREVDALFRRGPVAIAHVSELANPGDFVTQDVTGAPVLVVRRDDGQLGAFLNVCRHRGTQVEKRACGSAKSFACPYHGWTYGRDGRLAGVPHERGFLSVVKEERGLVALPVAEAGGLVWVAPSPSAAALDMTSYLGEVVNELAGFGIDRAHVYDRRSLPKAMSWKLALDIFLETYHIKRTHSESIYPIFFDNVGLVDFIGPHVREAIPKRSIRELTAGSEASWSLRHHANVVYLLFPNTLVLVEPDHAQVVHVFPDGPARCVVTAYMLVPEPPATDKARAYWDANARILYGATEEDFAMGESIQRCLSSGANTELVHGAFEHALTYFHREIERRIR